VEVWTTVKENLFWKASGRCSAGDLPGREGGLKEEKEEGEAYYTESRGRRRRGSLLSPEA